MRPSACLRALSLISASRQRSGRASPAAVAAAGQVAQKADQGGARALRAMYVRATVQCRECDKLRAVYCKQPLRKLEKLHAGRRAVLPDDTGSDSDGNACTDGDADGAAAAGSSGNASESTQPQARSSGALSTPAERRRSQRAAAAAASASMVRDATDSDSPQSASESDVTQDDADLDAHADSVSDANAETDASADEEAGPGAGAGADARAALPPSGASKRKRGRPRVAKRARPAGKAGRASAHGPGTYVHDEVQAACESGLYTCGAVLMPAGHSLDPATYCNAALTCAAPVESTLYNMSASAMNEPLVRFSKGLCSMCGIEQVSDEDLKEQGCGGNHTAKWAACPLCVECAAHGFKASSMRKTRTQSKRIVRGEKRARAVPAPRPAAAQGASEASSDYSE
jgi:hypothetical protein